MWVLEKIKENIVGVPTELRRYMGTSQEDLFLSSKAKLHTNILTPDKIPEFCLPPRLCKRNPMLEMESTNLQSHDQVPRSNIPSDTKQDKTNDVKTKNDQRALAAKKPLPFSAEGYGLAGIFESPNTRRKESLFHSQCPTYLFDRSIPATPPRLAKKTNQPKNTSPLSVILPLFSCKVISETSYSSDCSPLSSPYSTKNPRSIPSGSCHLKEATSCSSLSDKREAKGRLKKDAFTVTAPPSSPPRFKGNSLTLAPPVLFPLDVLQCQERLQREHVLPLQGHGKIRLSAERTSFPTNASSCLSTLRIRLVSVEGVYSDGAKRTPNCSVSVCLTPGKQQQQESATIRNCHSPVFNEDFFFTELSSGDLLELQLRLKVVDKAAPGTLRRGTVIGIITKPLCQLLSLKN